MNFVEQQRDPRMLWTHTHTHIFRGRKCRGAVCTQYKNPRRVIRSFFRLLSMRRRAQTTFTRIRREWQKDINENDSKRKNDTKKQSEIAENIICPLHDYLCIPWIHWIHVIVQWTLGSSYHNECWVHWKAFFHSTGARLLFDPLHVFFSPLLSRSLSLSLSLVTLSLSRHPPLSALDE